IRIANNEELSFKQEDIEYNGVSIECRINVVDPVKDSMPSPGKVEMYVAPGGLGVRVDSAVYLRYAIHPFYDSMVGKLIVHGATRLEAVNKMKRALDEFIVEGVKTTIPFHAKLMEHDVFKAGDFNTNFLTDYPIMDEEK